MSLPRYFWVVSKPYEQKHLTRHAICRQPPTPRPSTASSSRLRILHLVAEEPCDQFGEAVEREHRDPYLFGWGGHETRLAWQWPLAKAKLRQGDLAGAQAAIDETPKDCELCIATRGLIAAARGDGDQADRWLNEAMRLGPDMPQPYVERGRVRLEQGDETGAAADAQAAIKRGPHYAEAYRLLGDVLARQKNWSAAVTQYDKALSEAPAWEELKQARMEAAAHGS